MAVAIFCAASKAKQLIVASPPLQYFLSSSGRESVACHDQAEGTYGFHDDGVLGTRFEMRIEAPDRATASAAALTARNAIDRDALLLSWRQSHCELARLNAERSLVASNTLFEVLQKASFWRQRSRGTFDERLGAISRLWRESAPEAPDPATLAALTRDASTTRVEFDLASRRIVLKGNGELDLDGIAKGWIVDSALDAARRAAPDLRAILLSVGGDAACWRKEATGRTWLVGLPRAGARFDNAPLDEAVELAQGAIATSGRGQRDLRCGQIVNCGTYAAFDGQPITHSIMATAIAANACEADALATIALAMPAAAMNFADSIPGCAVRIVSADGSLATSRRWPTKSERYLQAVRLDAPEPAPLPQASTAGSGGFWPLDWRLELWWTSPSRQERGVDFRAPYMALWVTDVSGKPVRTISMVGRETRWQKENYIWWGNYRGRAERLIDLRSEATAPTGRYALIWDGRDDDGRRVPMGVYTLHVETSREKGQHNHRTLTLNIGAARFRAALENSSESGGFKLYFGSPNDDYDPE